jgi:hypothetical protein
MTPASGMALTPGRPGRGADPTAGLTDMQWYMYHQRNVAYFAAFATEDFTADSYLPVLRGTLEAAPHFAIGFGGKDRPFDGALLRRLITVETVPDFGGLPDRWLDEGFEVFSDPGLPMIRVRIARLAKGADPAGRRSFVVVRVAHPFTEGIDSALLTRSARSEHDPAPPPPKSPPLVTAGARLLGGLAALMHLMVSRLWTPHPGRIRVVTRVYPRKLMSEIARRMGVSQRALFVALTAHVIAGAALPGAKRKVTSTYSTLKPGGGANRDSFIRMRMLFAAFENRDDFAGYARAVDARLAEEGGESGFNAEMNAAAIGFHRGLARVVPRLYGPKVFAFMPYDFVFALLPPHRLGGPLTRGMVEPVYAGATLAGVNGCVVVPGREQIALEFAIEERLLPNVSRLDVLMDRLAAGAAVPAA